MDKNLLHDHDDRYDSDATAEELLEQRRSATGDSAAELERRCVCMHMDFARSLAARYFGRGIPAEDLEQVAYLALVKSVRRFDPARGDAFKAFAAVTIRGELRRHFRDTGWVVRPPRPLQELQARVWSAREELSHTLKRPPTVEELASALDADAGQVDEALGLTDCFSPTSLDGVGPHEDSVAVVDRVGASDPGFEQVDTSVLLAGALDCLAPRDRSIVRMRYFDGMTQRDIGERIGVTQMQVSRLLARIMRDLRTVITLEEAAA